MTPSPYQQEIYSALPFHPRGFTIRAVAGSGKTTTLIELSKQLPRHQTNVFLAFNVKIAKELEVRLPYWCKASTFHSFCKQQLKARVAPKKLSNFHAQFSFELFQAVGLAKANLTSLAPQPLSFYAAICDVGDFDVDPAEVKQLTEQSLADRKVMDFDDMLCFALEANFPKVHTLCVDEAQDLSPVQHAIINRIAPDCLIAVGDPAQSIYGFRGALSSSMEAMEEDFDLPTFPLSICYRCSTAVVEHANKQLQKPAFPAPTLEPAPNAPQGSVTYGTSTLTAGSVILCRNNAPLVSMLFSQIRKGRSCYMLGRDLEKRLLKLVKDRRASDIPELTQKLSTYADTQAQKLSSRKLSALTDRIDCIKALLQPGDEISDLLARISNVFAPTSGDLCFTTIHRAKGMEWPTVYFLDAHLIPSKYAITPEDQLQERNLNYVAITRAQEHLVYITSK